MPLPGLTFSKSFELRANGIEYHTRNAIFEELKTLGKADSKALEKIKDRHFKELIDKINKLYIENFAYQDTTKEILKKKDFFIEEVEIFYKSPPALNAFKRIMMSHTNPTLGDSSQKA